MSHEFTILASTGESEVYCHRDYLDYEVPGEDVDFEDRAGLQAMNFAMGFFYPGTTLKVSPEYIHFTFWVLSKKPRFAENHKFAADLDGRQIDLGDARYAAKPRENLEYLNFELSRNQLVSIAGAKSVIFRLGPYSFTATPDQRRLVNSVVRIADISITN